MLIAIVPIYTSIGEQKKEQYINISGLTVGQAQEKLQLKDKTEEI